jgi:hypothetical protein
VQRGSRPGSQNWKTISPLTTEKSPPAVETTAAHRRRTEGCHGRTELQIDTDDQPDLAAVAHTACGTDTLVQWILLAKSR